MNLKHPSLSNETLMVQAQARECYEVIIDIIKQNQDLFSFEIKDLGEEIMM